MKILSAQQIREADTYTIKNEPIKSIDLMERASLAFVNWFVMQYDKNQSVLVIAGAGNNGGDALAVARLLSGLSYVVKVYLALPNTEGSTSYRANLNRLPSAVEITNTIEDNCDVIIDGLFGSGLTRPMEGELAKLVDTINILEKAIVSIDIASGLSCDGVANSPHIIKPTYTISFQLPKLAFLLPENAQYVGNWHTVDIGLDGKFISNIGSKHYYHTKSNSREILNTRPKFGHKGIFGHALIIGGSYGKIGAVVLASKACLRAGVGLVTSLLPSCGYEVMQTAVPEVMCLTNGEQHLEAINTDKIKTYSAIGVGPGLGTSKGALSLLIDLLKYYSKPMVLDADALNLLALNPELLELLPANSILTPHIGEFNRLVGAVKNSLDRLELQEGFAKKHNIVLVLKGAHTSITDTNGEIWFNSTGNAGMATAGSGDVLTGIITSLLAQGYTSLEAAQLGVFLHGEAGDIAKSKLGEHSLIASDVVKRISGAFISIS